MKTSFKIFGQVWFWSLSSKHIACLPITFQSNSPKVTHSTMHFVADYVDDWNHMFAVRISQQPDHKTQQDVTSEIIKHSLNYINFDTNLSARVSSLTLRRRLLLRVRKNDAPKRIRRPIRSVRQRSVRGRIKGYAVWPIFIATWSKFEQAPILTSTTPDVTSTFKTNHKPSW